MPWPIRLGPAPRIMARLRRVVGRHLRSRRRHRSCSGTAVALGNSAAQVSTVLHAGHHAEALAAGAHKALVRAGQRGDLGVARAVLLEQAHRVGVDILHTQAADALLDLHHVVDTVEVPRIDAADGMDAGCMSQPRRRASTTKKMRCSVGVRHGLSELVVAQLVGTLLATGADALVTVLQRAHGLAEAPPRRCGRSP